MGAPSSTEVVVLPPDIVTTDEDGDLSLFGSIAAIADRG